VSAFAEELSPYAGGRWASVGGLADEGLLRRLRHYKRQVAKRYRILEPERVERVLTGGPYWVSPKHDGELWFLAKVGHEVALTTFNGRVLLETPLVKEAAAALADAPDLLIAGELVGAGEGDDRARVYHVASALKDERLEATLSFVAFDLVDEAGQDRLGAPYAERIERLRELLPAVGRARAVETVEAEGPAEIVERYREWVGSEQHEGVIVRSDRGLTYKVKRTLTLDAVVIAYGERITGEVRQMREMSVALLRDDGRWQLLGAVGTGFSEEDRAEWHGRLSSREVPSTFRLANREGTLSKFVRPEIVIEVRVSDLLESDSWDAPIRRMALAYDAAAGWRPAGEQPTAVMIHPIFLRERTDKEVSVAHVGMTQITSRVALSAPRAPAAPKGAPTEATVRARQAFVKETKGKVAVRKYVLLETHRDPSTGPAFVAYFTDFSRVGRTPSSPTCGRRRRGSGRRRTSRSG
jgi:hypothetical protein